MPIISDIDYRPSRIYKSAHLNTIATAIFRKVAPPKLHRRRVELMDGDFMDLDTSLQQRNMVAILVHGLEGDAKRPYMLGMANSLQRLKIDTINVNLRGCSGEPNRLLKSYHSGSTDDLQEVIDFVNAHYDYQSIILLGFSLGGNIVLKYTGDQAMQIDPRIKLSIGISVPCDLTSCAMAIGEKRNFIYMRRFLDNLRDKVKAKKSDLTPDVNFKQLMSAKNFQEFDHWFTAKVNGFESASHYWETCSSKPVLKNVAIPTLLINARDDSFLGSACFPDTIAQEHDLLHFLAPNYGGHVGFSGDDREGMLWSEYRVSKFVIEQLNLKDYL